MENRDNVNELTRKVKDLQEAVFWCQLFAVGCSVSFMLCVGYMIHHITWGS